MFKCVRATVSVLVALLSYLHCICFTTVVNHCVFEQINDDDDDDWRTDTQTDRCKKHNLLEKLRIWVRKCGCLRTRQISVTHRTASAAGAERSSVKMRVSGGADENVAWTGQWRLSPELTDGLIANSDSPVGRLRPDRCRTKRSACRMHF